MDITPINQTNLAGSTTAAAVASTRKSLDISITTAEGDRVTLNSVVSSASGYAAHQGDATAQVSLRSQSSESTLTIEGQLSNEELRDIAKALHAYSKVVKDSVSGRMQPAAAHARQISRLEEISSFDATFSLQQAFSAQIQTTAFEAQA